MESLIKDNIQYSNTKLTQSDIKKLVEENKNLISRCKSVDCMLMILLIESTDLKLKGEIAAYFYDYIYNNLRGDTSEYRFNKLEQIYLNHIQK